MSCGPAYVKQCFGVLQSPVANSSDPQRFVIAMPAPATTALSILMMDFVQIVTPTGPEIVLLVLTMTVAEVNAGVEVPPMEAIMTDIVGPV